VPKFSFECSCGVNFTRTLKMGDHKTHECPQCKESAPRVFEGFGFAFAQGGGAPANSGVTKHDYPTDDYVVGSSADKRWAEYREREKVKAEVRKVGGNRALIRKNGADFIEYQAGSDQTIAGRKKVRDEIVEVIKRPPAKSPQ
jgi:putative FmdB family regulatory protein